MSNTFPLKECYEKTLCELSLREGNTTSRSGMGGNLEQWFWLQLHDEVYSEDTTKSLITYENNKLCLNAKSTDLFSVKDLREALNEFFKTQNLVSVTPQEVVDQEFISTFNGRSKRIQNYSNVLALVHEIKQYLSTDNKQDSKFIEYDKTLSSFQDKSQLIISLRLVITLEEIIQKDLDTLLEETINSANAALDA